MKTVSPHKGIWELSVTWRRSGGLKTFTDKRYGVEPIAGFTLFILASKDTQN